MEFLNCLFNAYCSISPTYFDAILYLAVYVNYEIFNSLYSISLFKLSIMAFYRLYSVLSSAIDFLISNISLYNYCINLVLFAIVWAFANAYFSEICTSRSNYYCNADFSCSRYFNFCCNYCVWIS